MTKTHCRKFRPAWSALLTTFPTAHGCARCAKEPPFAQHLRVMGGTYMDAELNPRQNEANDPPNRSVRKAYPLIAVQICACALSKSTKRTQTPRPGGARKSKKRTPRPHDSRNTFGPKI